MAVEKNRNEKLLTEMPAAITGNSKMLACYRANGELFCFFWPEIAAGHKNFTSGPWHRQTSTCSCQSRRINTLEAPRLGNALELVPRHVCADTPGARRQAVSTANLMTVPQIYNIY